MQRLLLPRPVAPRPARRFRTLRCPRPSAAVEATAPEPLTVPPAPASPPPPPAEDGAARSAKDALLRLVGGTQRGVAADAAARVAVQEAVLAVEARCAAGPLDTVGALAGVWRLLYTTALDVLVLLEAERRQPLALFTVGDSAQRDARVTSRWPARSILTTRFAPPRCTSLPDVRRPGRG